MSTVPLVTLNTGAKMPIVGLGCWMGDTGAGERAYEMCRKAIAIGYRHIDTAADYDDEAPVGRAIRESDVPREELFITTKLNQDRHDSVAEALDESLAALGLDYVDLFLIHYPQAERNGKTLQPEEYPTINDTWADMEKVYREGKARAVGASNFSVKTLDQLEKTWTVVPAVNQVEIHPFLPQNALRAYCEDKGIHLTAFAPLGQPIVGQDAPSLLHNETIEKIAEKYGATTGQVLLGWGVQCGTSVIPKSEKEERLRSNLTILKLDEADVKTIDNLHKQPGLHRSLLAFLHSKEGVMGWTYEQLGWPFDEKGIVL
ncbi:unnamed protein product [Peniophora sp. CBMAI 1063]|nr:unnamed protein product [Peniophora sp. CBMAI 1063]